MNKNEKTATVNSGLSNNFNEHLNFTPRGVKKQINSAINPGKPPTVTTTAATGKNADEPSFRFTDLRLVCDECAAPLWLYGENFIETYTNGRANLLKCLCDLCAAEFLGVSV